MRNGHFHLSTIHFPLAQLSTFRFPLSSLHYLKFQPQCVDIFIIKHHSEGIYMSQTLTNPADGNKKKLMPLFIKAAVALAAVAVILVLTVQLSESMMM